MGVKSKSEIVEELSALAAVEENPKLKKDLLLAVAKMSGYLNEKDDEVRTVNLVVKNYGDLCWVCRKVREDAITKPIST